jgi:hypothetical protein
MAEQEFFEMDEDQQKVLNAWTRTSPALNAQFSYGPSNDRGFGDYLKGLECQVVPQALAVQLDEVGAITYIGEATPGSITSDPVWRVKRMDESGDPELIITYADGDSNFDNVWDNRLTLTYS